MTCDIPFQFKTQAELQDKGIDLSIYHSKDAVPFLGLPMRNWPYCQCGSLKMVSPRGSRGVWVVISWNGLRPAGMQLNGTNAQKEWQASCQPFGRPNRRWDEFKKHLGIRLEESRNINQPTS